MKHCIYVIFGSLLCLSNLWGAEQEKLENGRYQIVPAASGGVNFVFRIDTATGQTWRFVTDYEQGTLNLKTSGWLEVTDVVIVPKSTASKAN